MNVSPARIGSHPARTRAALVAAAAFATLCPTRARAQPKASHKAMATQLFDDGQKLMAQKNYAAACGKFRESERLDPELGTLLHLADCYEKAGKTASAWAAFQGAATIAGNRGDRREGVARRRMRALAEKLARLTIQVKAGDASGLKVELDGEDIGKPVWGEASPIDPGTHKVVVTATGHVPRSYTLTIADSQNKSLAVEPGAPIATAPAPAPAAAAAAAAAPAAAAPAPPTAPPTARPSTPSAPPPTADRGTGSGSRTLGYVIGGVGVVGLGVGAVTGAMVFGKKSTLNSHCDASHACDPTGMDAASSARTLSTISTVSFIVGAVGVGTGAYFIFSSGGKSEAPRTALSTTMLPGGGALSLTREF